MSYCHESCILSWTGCCGSGCTSLEAEIPWCDEVLVIMSCPFHIMLPNFRFTHGFHIVSQHVTICCNNGVSVYIYIHIIVCIHLSSWSLHKFACEIQTKHCLCAAVSKLSTCTSTHGQHGTDAFGFEFVDCEVHLGTAVANPGLLSAQLDTEKESMGPMCFLRVSSYLFLSCFCRRHQYALYRRSRNMFIGNHQRLPQI
jgi:hypothetical protein